MKNTAKKIGDVRSASPQWLTFRVTQKEKEIVQEQATFVGLSISEYMRRRVFGGRPVIAQVDEATLRELRRMGGLLKHNFETIRQKGSAEEMEQMNSTFRQITNCVNQISMTLYGTPYSSQKSKHDSKKD